MHSELDAMTQDPVYQDYAYMTFNDIRAANADTNDILIAVKAPIGTKIEVPDPN